MFNFKPKSHCSYDRPDKSIRLIQSYCRYQKRENIGDQGKILVIRTTEHNRCKNKTKKKDIGRHGAVIYCSFLEEMGARRAIIRV